MRSALTRLLPGALLMLGATALAIVPGLRPLAASLVPAYPLSGKQADQTVMRIVCRNGLSRDLAEDLMRDIRTETAYLDALEQPMPHPGIGPTFHH